jgi:pimeloyl-ACP methyl ester carboxylesterase
VTRVIDEKLAAETKARINFLDEPRVARWLRKLGGFCRVVGFDKRGTGLSDRVANLPAMDERMDDLRAVMDAVKIERAAQFGISEGGSRATLLPPATFTVEKTKLFFVPVGLCPCGQHASAVPPYAHDRMPTQGLPWVDVCQSTTLRSDYAITPAGWIRA